MYYNNIKPQIKLIFTKYDKRGRTIMSFVLIVIISINWIKKKFDYKKNIPNVKKIIHLLCRILSCIILIIYE